MNCWQGGKLLSEHYVKELSYISFDLLKRFTGVGRNMYPSSSFLFFRVVDFCSIFLCASTLKICLNQFAHEVLKGSYLLIALNLLQVFFHVCLGICKHDVPRVVMHTIKWEYLVLAVSTKLTSYDMLHLCFWDK